MITPTHWLILATAIVLACAWLAVCKAAASADKDMRDMPYPPVSPPRETELERELREKNLTVPTYWRRQSSRKQVRDLPPMPLSK